MIKLTERQKEVLAFLESHITENGAPPTRVEIAKEMGFRSPNAAEDHLRALNKKGVIELLPGTSRGIKINKKNNDLGVPLIGKVAAGSPIMAEENIQNYHSLDKNLFHQKPSFMLQVVGDSMINAGILEGDLLAVKSQAETKNGDIVVARIAEDVTVKRLNIKDNVVQLLPENEAYDPIEVDVNQDDFSIEGLVIGVIRAMP